MMARHLTDAWVAILVGICLLAEVGATTRLYGGRPSTSDETRAIAFIVVPASIVIVVSVLRFIYLS